MPSILSEIRKNYSRVFRRIFVKRRDASSGLFESTWQDISIDVKNWGKIRREIDGVKYSKVKFSDVMVKMNNFSGNPTKSFMLTKFIKFICQKLHAQTNS